MGSIPPGQQAGRQPRVRARLPGRPGHCQQEVHGTRRAHEKISFARCGTSEVCEGVTMGVLTALAPYKPARLARLARQVR
jgi:hypothetical protein